jgi:hypothetical protein
MGKKVILTDDIINEIIISYQTNNISIESLCKKYGVGKLKIKDIFINNGVKIKSKGAQVTIGNSSEIESSKTNLYSLTDNSKKLIAVCKKTNLEFDDANNLSGCLTKHILETYGNVPIPTNTYQRKKYELINGKKWFEEYFNIIEVDNIETRKCKLCGWETEDVLNKTGCFENHINKEHKIIIDDYLKQFPEDTEYHKNYIKKIKREQILSNDDESVKCLECGEIFIGLTNTHMKFKHGVTIDDYKKKWGVKAVIISNKTIKLLTENAIELNKNMISSFNSKPQKEIQEFIENELMCKLLVNNKKVLNGVEIDLYDPILKIGIEYNGLYWHCERMGKTKEYHRLKTILANSEGVRLIHIFEDEWLHKKDIVKNRLRHIFGKTNNKIYGRKCEVREISKEEKKDYLINTHIQGNDNSSIRLGIFNNDKLVGVMTFSKPRKALGNSNDNVNGVYELVRFASDNVVGGADKLLKYFIKKYKPEKIISYADRRWSQGELYEKLGFNLISTTKPNYWYTKNHKTREHRFNYRKDVLVSKGYDSNKTEFEIMNELGYDKIWDCGSFKFEMIL